jgi:hypothetical protein
VLHQDRRVKGHGGQDGYCGLRSTLKRPDMGRWRLQAQPSLIGHNRGYGQPTATGCVEFCEDMDDIGPIWL